MVFHFVSKNLILTLLTINAGTGGIIISIQYIV